MKALYLVMQTTWGFLQTLLGALVFIFNIKAKHYFYHGAIVTEWKGQSSVSLGAFIFITSKPYFYEKLKEEYTMEELSARLLVHEYGHTVQSIILGPFYLIFMGIPSTVWGFFPYFSKKRKYKGVSYFSFFTERWANTLGEKVLKQKSMQQLMID